MTLFPSITPPMVARLLGVCAALCAQRAHARVEVDLETTRLVLRQIAVVEDVKDPARSGPAGELGIYRLRPATWRQHTRAPFVRCGYDRTLEQAVAEKHFAWLVRSLIASGQVPTPYRLALAWNAGLEGSRRAPRRAHDYARRVVNLYTEATASQPPRS